MLVIPVDKQNIIEDGWMGRKFLCRIRDGDYLHFDVLYLSQRVLGVTPWWVLENDEHIINLDSQQLEEIYLIIEE